MRIGLLQHQLVLSATPILTSPLVGHTISVYIAAADIAVSVVLLIDGEDYPILFIKTK